MLRRFRAAVQRVFTPVAAGLLKLGVTPDAVTLVGTVATCAAALVFFPRGELFWGVIVITVFVLADSLDGTMARISGRTTQWGAFLDSTMDRVADACIFAGLVVWFAGDGDDEPTMILALTCLVLGMVVSYAKARAEGLGFTANVGVAERADRLVAALVATGLVGLGAPLALLTVVLALLAVASAYTVFQRMREVRRQALAATP
jgi:CDP-diacylglycerol--glycerol-3-phosphate 3-phosphatidyltransferase